MGFGEWFGLSGTNNSGAVAEVGTKSYLEVPAMNPAEELNSGTKVNIAFLDKHEEVSASASDEKLSSPEVAEVINAQPEAVNDNIQAKQEISAAPVVATSFSPEIKAEIVTETGEEDIDVHPELLAHNNAVVESVVVVEENAAETLAKEERKEKLSQATSFLQRVTVLENELRAGADWAAVGTKCMDLFTEIRSFVSSTEVKFRLDNEINKAIDEAYVRIAEIAKKSR